MKFLKLTILAVLLTLLGSVAFAETPKAASPKDEVRTTIDSLIDIVERLPGEENRVKRRKELHEVLKPRFDFREMSRRSLGPNWNEISTTEQEQFVEVFSKLLANTYLEKIENVKRNIIDYGKEEIDYPKALVKTTVTSKGDTFPIDYKLVSRDGNWKVYDVVIENIGLVANYRNEFAGIIRKDKFAGLLERLRAKNS